MVSQQWKERGSMRGTNPSTGGNMTTSTQQEPHPQLHNERKTQTLSKLQVL